MKNSIAVLLLLLSFSCAQQMEKEPVSSSESNTTSQLQTVPAGASDQFTDSRLQLVKKADYYFRVSQVKKTSEDFEKTFPAYGAFISSSKLSLETGYLQAEISVRVPSHSFNALLKEIDKHAVFIHYRNVSTQDVSKEFVDLESRLKTKREVETRYGEILRKKAGTIEELLEAERRIGILHEEIEATISRMNFLKDQVSYSTLDLKFYEDVKTEIIAEDNHTLDMFADAFSSGLHGIIEVALLLTHLWPIIIVSIIGLLIYRLRRKPAPL
jgi:hypothetical protein